VEIPGGVPLPVLNRALLLPSGRLTRAATRWAATLWYSVLYLVQEWVNSG